MHIKHFDILNFVHVVAVLWIILSSGTMFFCIMNMRTTIYILLSIALLSFFMDNSMKINCVNFKSLILIFGLIIFNIVCSLQYFTFDNNLIILIIRLLSLFLIQSWIYKSEFIKIYVNCMVVISVISLICFSFTMLTSVKLPGQITTYQNGIPYYYTFYHTIGYRIIYTRNAGPFWEAPAFQNFLNIAWLLVATNDSLFTKKKYLYSIVIITITIFTTMSTIGYICLGLEIIYMIVCRKRNNINLESKGQKKVKNVYKSKKRMMIILILLAMVGLVFLEVNYSIISYKLIQKRASYSTRFLDSTGSFSLATERWLTGFGIFNNYSLTALKTLGIVNNSNGMGALCIGVGYPIAILFVYLSWRKFSNLCQASGVSSIILLIILLLFHNSEHLWLYTFFLSFLFNWKNDRKKDKVVIQ